MNLSRHSPPCNVIDAHCNIVYHCKNGSFSNAEQTFRKMCEMMKFEPAIIELDSNDEQDSSSDSFCKRNYSDIQISHFQKSISTLIRYAPTIQDSLDYACFCLFQVPEPLRNESLEKIMTINLIYLYKRQGGMENFRKALSLIKTGVSLGYALPLETTNDFTNNSDAVFMGVSSPVLRYFGLNLSQDKKSII